MRRELHVWALPAEVATILKQTSGRDTGRMVIDRTVNVLSLDGGDVELASTDTFRLAIFTISREVADRWGVGDDGLYRVVHHEKRANALAKKSALWMERIDGKFPNYRNVLPDGDEWEKTSQVLYRPHLGQFEAVGGHNALNLRLLPSRGSEWTGRAMNRAGRGLCHCYDLRCDSGAYRTLLEPSSPDAGDGGFVEQPPEWRCRFILMGMTWALAECQDG